MGEKDWWTLEGRACFYRGKLILELKQRKPEKPRPEVEKPPVVDTEEDDPWGEKP